MGLRVQKYGGSSVSTPEQIKAIAKRIQELKHQGHDVIVVVSAMGKTTDQLFALASQISKTPNRRELDMLLTTGERISMALLSMALQELQVAAISLTGSQAGVLTDSSHSNARIRSLKPQRVQEELKKRRVVVLAGFQGVDPDSREITTLGRGGSDTTAVAMAAHFGKASCEILKDVDGVYSADPRVVDSARHLPRLDYTHLLEMTFWGAKVLHYRCVELAARLNIPLVISLAHGEGRSTQVSHQETAMFEASQILSINSLEEVEVLAFDTASPKEALNRLGLKLEAHQLPWPQLLSTQTLGEQTCLYLTAPADVLMALRCFKDLSFKTPLSTVSATCSGAVANDFVQELVEHLAASGVTVRHILMSSLTVTFLISRSERVQAIACLHQKIS